MQVGDLKAVYVIEQQSFPLPWSLESFRNELENNQFARYFCLMSDGQVVGYMGLWEILNEGHVTNLAVSPEYRCRGYGEFLIGSVMRIISDKGIKRMTLEVRVSNLTARKLYERLGFVAVGVRKGYYNDNHEDALIMWAELDINQSLEVNI
ncbi:MAG: ribosomal protein S18-alanine N-acetyltransferase [Desulfitobacteriaceae bacterium]|nr:ribosomal protein S18-alanine N-acetyltransferase [Desulfitobacteriaceae bacterium]MDD4345440.1 ribosomal protein S18-alanine N-acetyltransferase [Desulfitobacteriaceae bacterium]MDD4400713.1 ribosomal protein S18-alanine N-acetyltransferase [Desulfitobacteriaceae bacterium]